VKFAEIVSRVTGISTPIFGMSWNPPESERAVSKRIISQLEDRRVLYKPSEMEVPEYCVTSVIQIRQMLSLELGSLDDKSVLAKSVRAMRSACRKFLDSVQADDRIVRFGAHAGHFASWEFNGAVGELRGVFGVHLAQIAAQYGLDIEDDLAAILPVADESTEV
jgi:hypothetical protein